VVVLPALRFFSHIAIASNLVVLLALAAVPSLAETYRWTDKDGVVGYADSLQKVPSQYREAAKRVDRESPTGSSTKPFQVVPSPPQSNVGAPSVGSEESYAAWRDRMREARADLEQLKTQREAAQKDYERLRAELYVRAFGDPEADARYRARLAELDEQISQKEYELTTTIPDEARKAGIPPGVLNQ
jgi:DNA repair exonuclease SbcCD ATPase subunit